MKDDAEENRRTVTAYLDPVREVVQPVDVGLFVGGAELRQVALSLPADNQGHGAAGGRLAQLGSHTGLGDRCSPHVVGSVGATPIECRLI